MFEHKRFIKIKYNDIPLDTDCYLMKEEYMSDFEQAAINYFNGGKYKNVGYVSYITVRNIHNDYLEISWYPNIKDRFHELRIILPAEQILNCIEIYDMDEQPHFFIKNEWIEYLYKKQFSIFVMIDAIDIKKMIDKNLVTNDKLIKLRNLVDELAKKYPNISFISFADSIILKNNWTVGKFDSNVKYTYNPEIFLDLFRKIKSIYHKIFNLNIYGIFNQGSNEFYNDTSLHISKSKNHISLNSFGTTFAELFEIDATVRRALTNNKYLGNELYMDECFFHSINFKYEFDKDQIYSDEYTLKKGIKKKFYILSLSLISENLKV